MTKLDMEAERTELDQAFDQTLFDASVRARDRRRRLVAHLLAGLLSLVATAILLWGQWSAVEAKIAVVALLLGLIAQDRWLAQAGLYRWSSGLAVKIAVIQWITMLMALLLLEALGRLREGAVVVVSSLAVEWALLLLAERVFDCSWRPFEVLSLRPVYVVVWGSDGTARRLTEHLRKLGKGWRVVAGEDSFCSVEKLRACLFTRAVDMVLASGPQAGQLQEVAGAALELGLRFAVAGVDVQCISSARKGRCTRIGDLPVTIWSAVSWNPVYLAMKRAIDVVVATLALLCLSPLLILIAAVIKFNEPRAPVFYRLAQVGLNRRPIVCFKFRSMVPNADALQAGLMKRNEMQGPVFKIRSDPRVTRLGRFLRRYSLDELPQIYSVLKGDLSLVGPRAPLRSEVERFTYRQREKLAVKPGLTCYWQIGGRSKIVNFEEWIRLDLEYVHTASLSVDWKILWRTIPAVLRGDGAY